MSGVDKQKRAGRCRGSHGLKTLPRFSTSRSVLQSNAVQLPRSAVLGVAALTSGCRLVNNSDIALRRRDLAEAS